MNFTISRTATTPDQHILRSIMVPFAAAIVALLLAAVTGIYWLIKTEDRAQIEQTVNAAQALLDIQMDEEVETMKAGLAGVVDDPAFAEPLRTGNRAQLLDLARPVFDKMSEGGNVAYFFFGTADGATLLRAHAPDRFGDRFDHGLAIKALATGKQESGLDLGESGALSLRVADVYTDKGKALGLVELGVSFHHIADVVSEVLGVKVVTLIDKSRLKRATWEEGRTALKWPLPWDSFPAVAVEDTNIGTIPTQMSQLFAKAPPDGGIPAGYVTAGDRILYLAPLPILDEAGNRLGSLVVAADRTSLIRGSRILIGAIALLALGLAVLLLLVFHSLVRRIEQRIGKGIALLARTNADLERFTYLACNELQGPLEQVVNCSLALEKSASKLDDEGKRNLSLVAEGAESLENTVGILEDYLDLDVNARQMEPVVLEAVFSAALEKLQPSAADPNIDIRVMSLPTVTGRPLLLARAIFCILDSTLKARIVGLPLRIRIWAEEREENWAIWFTGVPRMPDNVSGGSKKSLDLAIARRVAQLHGGDIEVVSAPNADTAVLLTLRK